MRNMLVVEQAGSPEQEGAGTDRAITPRIRSLPSQPSDQCGACRCERVSRPGDDQRVDRLVSVVDRPVRHEAQAGQTSYQPRLFRDEPDVVNAMAGLVY